MPGTLRLAAPFLVALAFGLSAVLTALSIRYALRFRLIDEPGRRRSHSVPTPRGGGVAIVLAILACAGAPLAAADPRALAPSAALALVAAVGWLDDHRPLAAGWRFAAHWLAAALAFGGLWGGLPAFAALGAGPAFLLLGFAIVWSINLHNFMDGINGLLAAQAVFCLLALAVLLRAQDAPAAFAAAVAAAAAAGFLPFNFPKARIFMGDVGSGALGLAVALAGIALAGRGAVAACSAAVIVSAFVTDATCTLLSRMLRGRRWYSAHREHLYQWLVRCGNPHARAVATYMGWNLLIVLPVIAWMNRSASNPPLAGAATSAGPAVCATAAVYAGAVLAWCLGKRACLAAVRAGRRHVDAA